MNEVILEVNNLGIDFCIEDRVIPAVDGVGFSLLKGETLGIVGESGCGKSVTALSIMRLLQMPPARISKGEILFKGENLLRKSDEEMRRIRGRDISMIFQEPMTSLNPVFTIGQQISEIFMQHQDSKRGTLRSAEMLRMAESQCPKKPEAVSHQLSGG